MNEVVVKVPEDIGIEFDRVEVKRWQLLFSRFLTNEFKKMKEIESILAKSEMTEEQAEELADEVSEALAKRVLGD